MIKYQPVGNRSRIIRHWYVPSPNSNSVFWVQEMKSGRLIGLIQVGDTYYLPVNSADHIGLGLYNGDREGRAYPAYLEGLCLYKGGPSQPEKCSTRDMWELRARTQMVMDKMVDPDDQGGWPFIITKSGTGLAMGEAVFGTTEYRGLIHVYERKEDRDEPMFRTASPQSFDSKGGSFGVASSEKSRSAGIGLGRKEHLVHVETGLRYHTHSPRLIGLQVETHEDLAAFLGTWSHSLEWRRPVPSGNWWNQPSMDLLVIGGKPSDRPFDIPTTGDDGRPVPHDPRRRG